MRVLIVDDEVIIREGLRQVVSWSDHGFQLLEPAVSAEEAIKVMENNCPEIILTDIRMSGMSGLDLAAYVSEQELPAEVIVLTGYDEFSYAQEALRQGVSDYLLKASEPDAILDAVKKARDRLAATKEHVQWKQGERERCITSLIKKIVKDTYEQKEINQLKELIPELRAFAFQFILVDKQLPISEIVKMEKLWNTYVFGKWLQFEDKIAIIVTRDPRLEDEYLIQMAAKKISQQIGKPLLVSTVVSALSELPSSYREVKPLLLYQWILREKRMISLTLIKGRRGIAYAEKMKDHEEMLFNFIHTGNYQEFTNFMDELITWLFSHPQATPGSIQLYLQTLFISMLQFVNRIATSIGKDTKNYKSLLPPAEWFPSYKEFLLPSFTKIIDDYQNLVHRQNNYVQLAIHYMEIKLDQSVSLQEVADHVHVNPSYLSEMLRKETGASYVEFITELRMSKAVELLVHTPAKVKEVSNQVGYSDWKYFTSQFKKHFGLTPTQYRQRLKADAN
ncbi:response regulator [Gracilibacillus salitolerans]|uniref:Response regulator n=1 Tax=Gracilibacillus salitolerans TaxID=2663022 RepID=A0A5Q2TRE8_9BACI|nr:response regulator [Gracilibacillus salitolerans]QGH36801.1 response regulator [Gracilibacillus salitolerans]